jgi:hypothetical protein
MTSRRKKWLIFLTGAALIGGAAIAVFSLRLSHTVEPYIREHAISCFREQFNSDVELASLKFRMPPIASLKLWWTRGHGARGA